MATIREARVRSFAIAGAAGIAAFLITVGGVEAPARIWQFFLFPVSMAVGAGAMTVLHVLRSKGPVRAAACPVFALLALWIATDALRSRTIYANAAGYRVIELADRLADRIRPGDLVIGDMVTGPFRYYLIRHILRSGWQVGYLPKTGLTVGGAFRLCPGPGRAISVHDGVRCNGPQAVETRPSRKSVFLVTGFPLAKAVEDFTDYGQPAPDPAMATVVLTLGDFTVYGF